MNGMELTRAYAREIALPALAQTLGPKRYALIAAGSVGDGSDRFGFDDEVSRDHDWGVALCVWVPDGEDELAQLVRQTLAGLPSSYSAAPVLGLSAKTPSNRAGVFTVGDFYTRFIRYPQGPRTPTEWNDVPEHALAAATNGSVFVDGPGNFSAIRLRLRAGYPEPVRLKRLAEQCLDFSQAGQYNLIRAMAREDAVAKRITYARTHEASCRIVHLLAKRFCPYYKWMQASCAQCGELGSRVALLLDYLADPQGPLEQGGMATTKEAVDEIAELVLAEMQAQGIAAGSSNFLLDHVNHLRELVGDEELLQAPSN